MSKSNRKKRDKPLTSAEVADLLKAGEPGKHPDGRSLYLVVKRPGIGQWKGHYRRGAALCTQSLGGAPATTLAAARKAWENFRAAKRHGLVLSPAARTAIPALQNGHAAPRRAAPVPTGILFRDAVAQYLDAKAEDLRGGPTGKTARLYLADAAAKLPDGRVIGDLTWPELSDDVIALYVGTMNDRKARDTRIRLRAVRAVMESGKVKIKEKTNPHDSMPFAEIPQFYSELIALNDERAKALAFVLLTGIRVSDALGWKYKKPATWAEIKGDLWEFEYTGIRATDRAKTGIRHTIPLTPAALALLGDRKSDGETIFSVSYFQVYRLFKKLRAADADIHGFRASFRTWMQENDVRDYDEDSAEMALQHVGSDDETKKAYKRNALIEKRRIIMQDWSNYVTGKTTARA